MTAAVLLLFALAASLAFIPGFRAAVADRLGVHGIRIVIEGETPTPAATPITQTLFLGRPATLDEAADTAPFAIAIPATAAYGAPDEVYLRALSDGNTLLSLVYHTTPDLPETGETGVGALLMAFASRDNAAYLAKSVHAEGGFIQRVTVDGREAWWVTGVTSLTLLDDPSRASFSGGLSRPSGNVLLWEAGGVTYRLESALSRDAAIAFAESLTSPGGE
jgi:hypothetical protein